MPDRVLFIIASADFSAGEFQTCKEIFQSHHYTIEATSNKIGDCVSDRGTKVWCGRRASEIVAEDYEIIVVIGGFGASELIEDNGVNDLIHEANGLQVIIGAIGSGVMILVKSGILSDRKVVDLEGETEVLKEEGIHPLNQPVVTDGLIVTAKNEEAADEFALALLDAV